VNDSRTKSCEDRVRRSLGNQMAKIGKLINSASRGYVVLCWQDVEWF